jgi:hypothetical protein
MFTPETIEFATLDGFCGFLVREERYAMNIVAGPTKVEAYGFRDALTEERPLLAEVKSIHDFNFRFGQWYEAEQFIIELFCQFAPSNNRQRLIEFVSRVEAVNSAEFEDDGISQSATVRKGIHTKAFDKIQNPIHLAPFRSFGEIEQVDVPCVFRIKDGGSGPQFQISEAGGGHWKLEAIKRIESYIMERINKLEK